MFQNLEIRNYFTLEYRIIGGFEIIVGSMGEGVWVGNAGLE